MNFKIDFKASKEYYEEAYDEMISSYKLKKWEPIFALLLVVFGIVIYFIINNKKLKFLPFIFILLGFYELIKFYNEKKKWINSRLKSKIQGENIKIEFYDDYLIHSGPFSNGQIKWNGLNNIQETSKGIILKLESGTSIYVSKANFKMPNEIDFILSKKYNSL
ncbi:YcxB family protein [Flavobacterium chungnamense]|uniref:YcxB-like C-terminal domain-containing protein n=1 Tax=Flavobacterium chungnamense TaxID=706182 RepID=A0ABP7UF63_9FLAO